MTLSLRQLYRINNTVAYVLSIYTNLLLVVLILKKTPKELKLYSVILLQVCVVDFLYSTIYFVDMPVGVSVNGTQYYMQTGFFQDVPYLPNYLMLCAHMSM